MLSDGVIHPAVQSGRSTAVVAVLHGLAWLTVFSFAARAIHGHIAFLFLAELTGFVLLLMECFLWGRHFDLRAVVTALMVLFVFALSIVVNGFASGMHFLPLMAACLAVSLLWQHSAPSHAMVCMFVYTITGYVLGQLVSGVDPNYVVKGSQNQISVLLINLVVFYCISCVLNDRKISILPAALAFVGAIASIGAVGIAATTVLFAGILGKKLVRHDGLLVLLTIAAAVGVWLALTHADFVTQWITFRLIGVELSHDAASKLDLTRYTGNEVRFEIWREYFATLEWWQAVVGRPLEQSYANHTNLHNAFILFHSRGGVFILPVIAIILLAMTTFLRKNLILFFCLLSLVVRAMGDTTMLGTGVFDWVLLSVIFLAFGKGMKYRQSRSR